MALPQALAVVPRTAYLDGSDLAVIDSQANELMAHLRYAEARLADQIKHGAGDNERILYADIRAALGCARFIRGAVGMALD